MLLKIDLHTHTNIYSGCSILAPERLCELALERGLNGLAITEHHYQWQQSELAALQARFPALKLYAGVEISCLDGRDYVVLGLQGGAYQPMPYLQLEALLRAHGNPFCFVAHAFRHNDREEGLAERAIDGIEVASYNILARPQPSDGPPAMVRAELYARWQQRMGWVGLYNSDGHAPKMMGLFYNQVETGDGVPADEAALGRLLRQAPVNGVANQALIRQAIP